MNKNLRDSPSRLAALSERKVDQPARPRSPGRPKSPARNKSPRRPKSSPAANARSKSPARPKSPARATKAEAEKKPRAKSKSPSRKAPAKEKKAKSPSRSAKAVIEKIDPIREPTISPGIEEVLRRSRERSILEEIRASRERSSVSVEPQGVTLRRSARVKSSIDRDGLVQTTTDRILKANHVGMSTKQPSTKEFGGWPGALILIFLLPVTVLALQLSCLTKERCNMLTITRPPLSWKYYLDLSVAQWFAAFLAVQAVLSALPLGRIKQGVSQRYGLANPQYRCTGFQIAVLTLSAVAGLQYLGYPMTLVLSKSVTLLVQSIILGLLVSVALYVKGGRPSAVPNPNGSTGNVVYDFWIGREINPRLGIFDVKQFLLRTAVIESLIYDGLVLWKAIDGKQVSAYPPTLVAITLLQALVMLDHLWHEEQFLSSFHTQHEGCGYMTVMASLIWPFAATFVSKYLLLNSLCKGFQIAVLTLSAVAGLQYLGYPMTLVLSKSVTLLVQSIILGLLVSVALYVKGGRPSAVPNPNGSTGNVVYDFWIGREINPRLGIFDVKQFLLRTAVIESLIYDGLVLWKAIDGKQVSAYPPTLVAITLLVQSIILGLLVSVALYVKGGRPSAVPNPNGSTGNVVYDFWIGREINPRLGIFDVKQFLLRTAVIESLIYDGLVLWKAIDGKQVSAYPPTLVAITLLQALVMLDHLWHEEQFLSSFHTQHEGCGYMTVMASLIWPFAATFLIYDGLVLWKAIDGKQVSAYPPTLVAITLLQALVMLDHLWHEEQFLSSFHTQHEGCGYMTVMASLIWPFAATFVSKYLLLNSPISVQNSFSKIHELLAQKAITEYLSENKLLSPCQFGFRSERSTTDAMNSLISKVYDALDEGKKALGLFVDLRKAFESLDHDVLFEKLVYYGFRGPVLKWLKSFISNRSQVVEIVAENGHVKNYKYRSQDRQLTRGVPQVTQPNRVLCLVCAIGLPVIQTTTSKKLLCGGWWGWSRHPNYFGSLVMYWAHALGAVAAAATATLPHWALFVVPVGMTVFLLHRAVRDHRRCQAVYGNAWDRYTHKVKYHLVPRVF
ncbi:uncharacterized protein LOC111059087 [Nilaparvata lugens]|uniref:uncharacterized protein LOC111059087 n=1 Tax=Nilaparvata lugens TaxID=108931 RepID=UPI00193D8DF2|nr:uncharacterized protein LOC111059087 [Nilaparvata lugens]